MDGRWLPVMVGVGCAVSALAATVGPQAGEPTVASEMSALSPHAGAEESGRQSERGSAAQGEIAREAAAAIFAVRADGCGVRTLASGFLAEGLIVTNRHVVGGAATVTVGAPLFAASLLVSRVADGLDLAIAPAGIGNGLVWADADPEVGAQVVMAGRGPGGYQWRSAHVHLYSEPGVYGGLGIAMLLDAPIVPGFSGGPVLDADGHVVGVLRAVDTSTDLTVAEPVSEYRSWLREYKYGDKSTSCIEEVKISD